MAKIKAEDIDMKLSPLSMLPENRDKLFAVNDNGYLVAGPFDTEEQFDEWAESQDCLDCVPCTGAEINEGDEVTAGISVTSLLYRGYRKTTVSNISGSKKLVFGVTDTINFSGKPDGKFLLWRGEEQNATLIVDRAQMKLLLDRAGYLDVTEYLDSYASRNQGAKVPSEQANDLFSVLTRMGYTWKKNKPYVRGTMSPLTLYRRGKVRTLANLQDITTKIGRYGFTLFSNPERKNFYRVLDNLRATVAEIYLAPVDEDVGDANS